MAIHPRAMSLVVTALGFAVLAVITTFLRVYARARLIRHIWWDDGVMIAATIAFIVHGTIATLGSANGFGAHQDELDDYRKQQGLSYFFSGCITYVWSLSLARVSIGLFFLRIAPVNKFVLWLVYINIGGNIISGTCYLFVVLFQCSPVNYYWTKAHPSAEGTCIDPKIIMKLGFFYGAACIACDIGFMVISMCIVGGLNLKVKTKMYLVPSLSLAGLACLCPIGRMFFIHSLGKEDLLYSIVPLGTFSTCETGFAICASNIATLRPLLAKAENWRRTNRFSGNAFVMWSLNTITVTRGQTRMGRTTNAADTINNDLEHNGPDTQLSSWGSRPESLMKPIDGITVGSSALDHATGQQGKSSVP